MHLPNREERAGHLRVRRAQRRGVLGANHGVGAPNEIESKNRKQFIELFVHAIKNQALATRLSTRLSTQRSTRFNTFIEPPGAHMVSINQSYFRAFKRPDPGSTRVNVFKLAREAADVCLLKYVY